MKNNKHQILYKALVLSLAIIIIIFNNNKALSLNEITAEKIDLKAEDIEPAAVLPLSIESVTDLALKNSLEIQIAKYDTYRSRTKLEKEESIFDTFLTLEASHRDNKQQLSSTTDNSRTRSKSFSMGLEKTLPTGSTIELKAEDGRTSSSLSTVTISPNYETSGTLALTQPLGKNFFGLQDRGEIKITKIDIENAKYSSLDSIESIIYNVQTEYWNLALRDRILNIRNDMLNKSKELYAKYEDKYSRGLAEEVDIFAVKASLQSRKNELLIAELERELAKNNLLFLLNEEDSSINIKTLDGLKTELLSKDIDTELERAIEARRDYKIIKNKLKSKDIDISMKKNSLWPEIDLEASFTKNGIRSSESDAWSDLSRENDSQTYVGISFNIPLENRAARSELKEAHLYKEQLLLSLKKVERLILKEVYNKVKSVNSLKSQAELYNSIVELQRNKLHEEMKRFNYGRSSSDTVIRYEEDLLNAELNLAATLYNYHISLIDLAIKKNTLLDKYWNSTL
ncbi:MAG: TolC family protein [Candidatus Kaelpia aquatica]|nr:TolC family protein [Candidatus Kaelpia aquatica]